MKDKVKEANIHIKRPYFCLRTISFSLSLRLNTCELSLTPLSWTLYSIKCSVIVAFT